MPVIRSKFRTLQAWIRSYWPVLLPLLVLLPWLNGFPYPSAEAPYSDLTISHYPNAVFLRKAISRWGQIPLWSPTILSGYPFAANPLSGLWYPPGWFALLLPLPLGFNLLISLHLLLGAAGLICFLRLEGLSRRAALLSGLAFAVMPKLFAHYGAGHLTLLYTVSWTPWLLVSSHRQMQKTFHFSGLILALIFLADPRWVPFAGLLWWGYVLAYSQFGTGWKLPQNAIFFAIKRLLLQSVVAILLSAPLLLPLMEYVGLSTRDQLASSDVFSHSLPPSRLLGLLFPDFGGSHEWMLYPGAVVLVLAIAALLGRKRGWRIWFWAGAFCLSLFFSMGAHIPGLSVLARLPGLNLLRVPPRALFLTGMAAAILAAYGFDALESGEVSGRVTLIWMALCGFGLSLALGVRAFSGEWAWPFVWGAGVLLAASLWGLARLYQWLPTASGYVILVGIAVFDWGFVDASVLSFHPKKVVLAEEEAVAQFLAAQPVYFRVYSPSYSLPQHTAASFGLELADGVDPLQLRVYADFMDVATGVPRGGYSVTLPPFAEGEPEIDNAAYAPDPAALGLLNVRYVAAEFDLSVNGLVLRERFGETRLYENLLVLPRAWVQSNDGVFGDRAEVLAWQPNKVHLQAEGPGTLVLSEIAYPGWRVQVDGQTAALRQVKGLFRGVKLPPGVHQVEFRYVPVSVYIGLAGWFLGLATLVWFGCRQK